MCRTCSGSTPSTQKPLLTATLWLSSPVKPVTVMDPCPSTVVQSAVETFQPVIGGGGTCSFVIVQSQTSPAATGTFNPKSEETRVPGSRTRDNGSWLGLVQRMLSS